MLKEFARDLTDSQIQNVAPVILPDMYRIFMEQGGTAEEHNLKGSFLA